MGNLLCSHQEKRNQEENINNHIDYSSTASDTKTTDPNEMMDQSIESNTTHTKNNVTSSSISATTTTTANDIERCYGCEKTGVTLYTRGMMQLRVCGDCID